MDEFETVIEQRAIPFTTVEVLNSYLENGWKLVDQLYQQGSTVAVVLERELMDHDDFENEEDD